LEPDVFCFLARGLREYPTNGGTMEREQDQGMQDEQGEGRLTDEVLEEKLREGKGPLPFVPGGDGEELEPPLPESTPEAG
jgi:hypothetical protein